MYFISWRITRKNYKRRKEIADNYRKAIVEGENDGWIETDNAYYDFSLSMRLFGRICRK